MDMLDSQDVESNHEWAMKELDFDKIIGEATILLPESQLVTVDRENT